MSRRCGVVAVIWLIAASSAASGRQNAGAPVAVEPGELVRRQDLVGREIVVDDRVAYYVARTGSDDDEVQLKRTPVTFLIMKTIPTRMRTPPAIHAVRALRGPPDPFSGLSCRPSGVCCSVLIYSFLSLRLFPFNTARPGSRPECSTRSR